MAEMCQEKYRKMIFNLSGRLKAKDCENIRYLADLPTPECCADEKRCSFSLHMLCSLEANGHISPWNVDKLESLLVEIHHKDLLQITSTYKESKEYKNALKERKKRGKKTNIVERKSVNACACTSDHLSGTSDRKRRVRSLYTLLITHITGLTQVMEILREELNEKMGEEAAMERFLKVAEDGESFTEDLHRVFQDMGIKPNRNSVSSEETPATTPNTDTETRQLTVTSQLTVTNSPLASPNLRQKKPMPLPRTKHSTPPPQYDAGIYENLGPIKQDDGCTVSLSEYFRSVQSTSTPKLPPTQRNLFVMADEDSEEEADATENTGDSGICEWTGHRAQSEGNLLSSTPPQKDGLFHITLDRAQSDGAMLDSTPCENDTPIYTPLRRKDSVSEYTSVSYRNDMQRS